jgi:hypothetical protein
MPAPRYVMCEQYTVQQQQQQLNATLVHDLCLPADHPADSFMSDS